MTFRHRAGVSSYTSAYALAETCVFGKQSPGPFHCDLHRCRHPLFRSYGVNMPSSLTTLLPLALGFSPHLPVSVCGTGATSIPIPFLAAVSTCFPTKFQSLTPGATNARVKLSHRVSIVKLWRLRNINRMCIDYASRPRLSSRLTPGGRTYPGKP